MFLRPRNDYKHSTLAKVKASQDVHEARRSQDLYGLTRSLQRCSWCSWQRVETIQVGPLLTVTSMLPLNLFPKASVAVPVPCVVSYEHNTCCEAMIPCEELAITEDHQTPKVISLPILRYFARNPSKYYSGTGSLRTGFLPLDTTLHNF